LNEAFTSFAQGDLVSSRWLSFSAFSAAVQTEPAATPSPIRTASRLVTISDISRGQNMNRNCKSIFRL
jgi:hypothetical protein